MERHGLDEAAYEVALCDPRTMVLVRQGARLPLLTPYSNHHWANTLYSGIAVPGKEPYYYLPGNFGAEEAIAEWLPRHVDTVLVLTEAMEGEVESVCDPWTRAAKAIGYRAITSDAYHTHFYSKMSGVTNPDTTADWHFEDLEPAYIEAARHAGRELMLRMDESEVRAFWPHYRDRNDTIVSVDPINPAFTQDEFMEIMQSPSFLKLPVRDKEGNIQALALWADIRNCSWMNQSYFEALDPVRYEGGRIWLSPGIMTTERANIASLFGIFDTCRHLLTTCHIDAAMAFVCNDESVKQVPRITHRGFNKEGLAATFDEPVGRLVFRTLAFDRE